MNEKALKLFENEEFLKKVLPMEPAEAVKAFAAEGADITEEELLALAEEIKKKLSAGDELDETALDDVAGGLTKFQKAQAVTAAVTVIVATGTLVVFGW